MVRSDGELDAPLPHTHTHMAGMGPQGGCQAQGWCQPSVLRAAGRSGAPSSQGRAGVCDCGAALSLPREPRNVAGGEGKRGGGPQVAANGAKTCNPSAPCNHLKTALCKQLPGQHRAPFLFPACASLLVLILSFFFFFNDDDDDLNFIFFIRARSQPAPAEQSGATRGGLQLAPAARWLLAAGLLGVFKPCENPGSW